jgi:hypothetical protein
VVSLAMHVGDVEVVKRGLIATSGNNVIGLLGSMISDPQFGPDARQVLDDYRIRQIANICAVSDVEAVFASLSPDRLVAVARLLLDRGHPDFSQRLSAHLNSEFNQASGGATPRRPEELLIQFALALADTPEQLRGLAPSIGVMATESPIRTASLVERLPATSQSMALAAANSSALVPLLRAENDPDDKDARSTNDAVTMMLRIMRDWGQLSDERTTEYVAACARAMDESEQIDARASWLHRLESWPSRVSDIDVLGQLTTGLAPLAQLSALTSADQGAAAGVATAVLLSEIVVASKAQVPNAQAWLVGVVVSEDISSAVGDAFRDGLSRAVKAFMPWAWPFADDLLACAESSNARGAAFRRTCQLLDLMVRKSTDERGFTKEQLDRVAGALLRDAPASAFGPLLAGTLGNPSAKECVLRRISVPGSVPRSLVPALWEQCSEARVPILNQHVFAGSERSVASGIRKLQSLVGQTALQDSMADYFDSLTGEDAATALRVVRGLSRSSVAAPVGSASKLLLRAVGASDRATNIELLGEAVKLGVPLSMKKQWQEAAKGIDDGGIGHNQKQVLTRARKALGIRRRR